MSQDPCETIYDVVIVGGGIAGAILAKTLVNAGKTVLILEAGDGVTPSPDAAGVELDIQREQAAYQDHLDAYYTAVAKVPNAPYPNLTAARSPDVLDIKPIKVVPPARQAGYFVQTGPLPFGSDY